MAITAAMVKELREQSGAGMMDCKKALTATDGDMEKAIDYLRENGMVRLRRRQTALRRKACVKDLSLKTARQLLLSK